jgi:hypothetical protein
MPTLTRPSSQLLTPPEVPWPVFYETQWKVNRQGQHMLFVGPTQSGKTRLCREIARLRQLTVVLGSKPVDESYDEYVAEGYVRIDHWPPRPSDYKKLRGSEVRFILWPEMKKREDLRRFRPAFLNCMESIFIQGKWCIVADEGLWLSSRKGLNLGDQLSDLAFGSASNKVSLYLCVQRPANVPPITWTSVTAANIFHMGRSDDVRELASLGVYPPRDVIKVVQGLGVLADGEPNPGREHEFLHLPCRGGGSRWAVSQIDVIP